jgi:hypothetical protein
MHQKKRRCGGFREALPSCVVCLVRKTFPEADPSDYAGFIPKLPSKFDGPGLSIIGE